MIMMVMVTTRVTKHPFAQYSPGLRTESPMSQEIHQYWKRSLEISNCAVHTWQMVPDVLNLPPRLCQGCSHPMMVWGRNGKAGCSCTRWNSSVGQHGLDRWIWLPTSLVETLLKLHHSLRHFLPNLSSLYLLYGSYLHRSLTTLLIFFSQVFSSIRLLYIKSCLSFISQRTQASTSSDRSNLKKISGKTGPWVWLTLYTIGKENIICEAWTSLGTQY